MDTMDTMDTRDTDTIQISTKKELSQLPWKEVKKKIEQILEFNASNNKVTYSKFKLWDDDQKKIILSTLAILGYSTDNKVKYNKIRKTFKDINTIVAESRKPINADQDRLKTYEKACERYFQLNSEQWGDQEEQENIIKWYLSYRGMANLGAYHGNLDDPNLKDRTIQHMMQDTLSQYIQQESVEEDRTIGVDLYKQDLKKALTKK
ncbi:hypothetical protein KBB05_01510 [Patescibacteria group bacterium]|nr:hypothetical protein [Patescibacteria group bacterium]